MDIIKSPFGITVNGDSIEKIDLINNHRVKVSILTYGGIIQCIETSDEDGHFKDIVLGYDTLEAYEKDPYYMGAVIGPVAGRITSAQIPLNGKLLQLDSNAGKHHLHGGHMGLNKKIWLAETEIKTDSVKVVLKTKAKNGEGGYPGNREFKTSYILNNKNQLMVYFDAVSDADTVVNMTSHSYFNLSNNAGDTINEHLIMINSLKTIALTEELIPNGSFDYVLGKPTNFSRGKLIGEALAQMPTGLDHVYIINKVEGKFGITAKVVHPENGRVLEIVTDQTAVVFYSNNFPKGDINGKQGLPINKHGAFCLETQNIPDAPNHAGFPSIFIKAGEKYKSRTQLTFGLASNSHHH